MKVPRVLIVEDEIAPDKTLRRIAPRQRFRFDWQPASASRSVGTKAHAVVVIHSGAESCRTAFRALQTIQPSETTAALVFLADRGSEALATEALRRGFDDYFSQPLQEDALWSSLQRLASDAVGPPAASPPSPTADLVGVGLACAEIRRLSLLAAQCSSNVLITGESGVGKEVAARRVHSCGARKRGPFVAVNVAALPDSLLESELFGHERGAFTGADVRREGKIRQAAGGTLFLDEIGDMSLQAQAKILRVIESREVCSVGGSKSDPVDFRLVAATNRDLGAAVRRGTFRLDLYHRLNVIRLDIPALRQRTEDIPSLVDHFIAKFNAAFGRRVERAGPALLNLLMHGEWPGNVRELSNAVEAAFVNQPDRTLEVAHLPTHIVDGIRSGALEPGGEKERLIEALVSSGGNRARAARKLNWSRMTLYRKLSRYRISREFARRPRSEAGAVA